METTASRIYLQKRKRANAIYVDVSGSRQRGGVDGMEGVDVVEGEYSGRAGV